MARVYDGSDGGANPFLHLSMHLSISEQCSIDQPRGIRQAVELLAARRNSLHDAHHEAMECLGQMLWESQRVGRPPDGAGVHRMRAAARHAGLSDRRERRERERRRPALLANASGRVSGR